MYQAENAYLKSITHREIRVIRVIRAVRVPTYLGF